MAGKDVAEKSGGSNRRAKRTIAREKGKSKKSLTREKKVCSQPGGLLGTTARGEETNTISFTQLQPPTEG
ncbi:hypothetical protein IP956_17130 [Leptospira borgpetersenii serovar Hardjo-bovis]|nr:hypothetical protein [Leptospira borgpetersenii serovar Hardjo-bovis]